jgi:hypothetical protein
MRHSEHIEYNDNDNQTFVHGWKRARIVSTPETEAEREDREELNTPLQVTVNFLCEIPVDFTLPVSSTDIAPVGFNTPLWDVKMNLTVGDHVDVCDESHDWYRATIIGKRECSDSGNDVDGNVIEEIIIGFRYYDKSGPKADPNGRAFIGYSPAWDVTKLLSQVSVQLEGTMVHPYTTTDGDDCLKTKNTKSLWDFDETVYVSVEPREYCVYRRESPITEFTETMRVQNRKY